MSIRRPMQRERVPPAAWPVHGRIALEVGVSLSTYLGAPTLLGSVCWIVVHRVAKGTPSLTAAKTWLFSGAALLVIAVGWAITELCWWRWGRARDDRHP